MRNSLRGNNSIVNAAASFAASTFLAVTKLNSSNTRLISLVSLATVLSSNDESSVLMLSALLFF